MRINCCTHLAEQALWRLGEAVEELRGLARDGAAVELDEFAGVADRAAREVSHEKYVDDARGHVRRVGRQRRVLRHHGRHAVATGEVAAIAEVIRNVLPHDPHAGGARLWVRRVRGRVLKVLDAARVGVRVRRGQQGGKVFLGGHYGRYGKVVVCVVEVDQGARMVVFEAPQVWGVAVRCVRTKREARLGAM